MSYTISTLLTRNLNDVFGEHDPARRRAAIDEIFTEDCVFHEPRGVYRGRDEIDRIAGAIKATHPDFRYQPIAPPEELGNGGRVRWVSGRPVRRQRTPGLISSLPGTAGLPPLSLFRPVSLSFQRDLLMGKHRTVFPHEAANGPSLSQSSPSPDEARRAPPSHSGPRARVCRSKPKHDSRNAIAANASS